jgi:hypothetical protein
MPVAIEDRPASRRGFTNALLLVLRLGQKFAIAE